MSSKASKTVNYLTNSLIGIFTFTIIPALSSYTGFFNDFGLEKTFSKMEITVSILIGLCAYMFVRQLDIKYKLIALKKYRDFEALAMLDFYNAEIKKLNDRLKVVEEKSSIQATDVLNENEKRLFEVDRKFREEKIKEYNSNFEGYGIGNYGLEDNKTYYKGIGYKTH